MRILAGIVIAASLTTSAAAELKVQFLEGAPKDRFVITNTGSCDLAAAQMLIDLSGSPYGLIFDVSGQGAGVEVFQPLEFTDGSQMLKKVPRVKDGDNQILLDLKGLQAGEKVAFTIDIDDTADSREITVSNSEFLGAAVELRTGATVARSAFDAKASAFLKEPNCS